MNEYINLETIEGTIKTDSGKKEAYGNTAVQLKSTVEGHKYTVDLPILQYFPNGMFRINDVYDEITKTQVIKRIGVIDLTNGGTDGVTWQADSDTVQSEGTPLLLMGREDFYVKATFASGLPFKQYAEGEMPNILIPCYTTTECKDIRNTNKDECTIYNNSLFIHDSNNKDINKFRGYIKNVKLYYELPEPVVIDLNPTIFIEFIASETPILEPTFKDKNKHANYHSKIRHNKEK